LCPSTLSSKLLEVLLLRLLFFGSTVKLVLAFGEVRVMTDGVTVEDGAVLDSPDAAKVFAAKRFFRKYLFD